MFPRFQERDQVVGGTLSNGQDYKVHYTLEYEDDLTKLLQDAKAIGAFQLESSGMRDLLRKLHPTVFEDIIALIALGQPRPGPGEGKQIKIIS